MRINRFNPALHTGLSGDAAVTADAAPSSFERRAELVEMGGAGRFHDFSQVIHNARQALAALGNSSVSGRVANAFDPSPLFP